MPTNGQPQGCRSSTEGDTKDTCAPIYHHETKTTRLPVSNSYVEITPEAKGLGRSPACVDYDGAPLGLLEQRLLLAVAEAACLAEPPPPPDPDFRSAETVEQMPAAVKDAIYNLLHASGKWTDRHHAKSARVIRAVLAAGQLIDVYPTDLAASNALDVGSSAFSTWKKQLATIRGGHLVPPPRRPSTPPPPPTSRSPSPAASELPMDEANHTSVEGETPAAETTPYQAASPPALCLPPQLTGDAFPGGPAPQDTAAAATTAHESGGAAVQAPTTGCAVSDDAELDGHMECPDDADASDPSTGECPICNDGFDREAAMSRRGEQAWGYTPCCSNPIHFTCLSTWLAGGPKRTRQHVAADGAIANTQQTCPMCRASITRRALVQHEPQAVQTVVLDATAVDDTPPDAHALTNAPDADHAADTFSDQQLRAYTRLLTSLLASNGRHSSVVTNDATTVAYLMGTENPRATTVRTVVRAVQQLVNPSAVFRQSIGGAATRRIWVVRLQPLHDAHVRSLPSSSIMAASPDGSSSATHAPFPPPPPVVPPAPSPSGGDLGSTAFGSHNLNMSGNEPIAHEEPCDRSTALGNCFVGYDHPRLNDAERERVCDAFDEAARRIAGGEVLKPPTLKAIATVHKVTVADGTPTNYGGALLRAMRPLLGTRPKFKCSRSCIGRRCHKSTLTAWATRAFALDTGESTVCVDPFDLGEGIYDRASRATAEYSTVRRRVSSSDASVYTDVAATRDGNTAPLPANATTHWHDVSPSLKQSDLPVGVTAHVADHYAQRGIVGQAAADELHRMHESAKTVEGAETDGSALQSRGRTLHYLAGRHTDEQAGETGEADIMARRTKRFTSAVALAPPPKGKVAWSGGKIVTNKFDAVAAFIKRKRATGTMPKDLEQRLNASLHPYGHVEYPTADDGHVSRPDDLMPKTPMEEEPLDAAPSRAEAGTPTPTCVRACTPAAPVRVDAPAPAPRVAPPTRTRDGPPRHAGRPRTRHEGTAHATPRPH